MKNGGKNKIAFIILFIG